MLVLLLSQSLTAQVTSVSEQDWAKIPSHPFLFANDNRILSIKTQKDTVSQQLQFIIKQEAEKRLFTSKINYPNDASNLVTSRDVQGRIISLAMAYRLFSDKRFLVKAKQELLQLAALRDWGVGHFLDVGEASLAAGIGLDWLYNELTETERKTIANAIRNNALLPSLKVPESNNNSTWVNGNFNWNPVCHAGLMVGALAIAEFEPALSKQIVARGVKNIPIAGDAYSPDGAFAEGPSYWSYGTSFYVLSIEALRSAFANSASLEKVPGFLKTADYRIQMVGATGEDYNYSDYHHENLNEPIMLWFAKELNRPDLLKKEIKSIDIIHNFWLKKSAQQSVTYTLPTEGGELAESRHTPFEILWWHPSLNNQQNKLTAPLHFTATGLMPIAVMRSSWNNPKATFVAIKGGTPNNSHGHMDAGSFILEANGVRWAVDLGTESYDKMRAAKLDLWNYGQNSS
ncbi:MAG: heparinase II/III family protein, partial [Deinococcales bacterium]|nr:heparinase II/III family protein [Chitinophagaceae bacterium]